MHKAGWATLAVAGIVIGCAAAPGTEGQGSAYESNEPRTGSNIVTRERRAQATPEERERARIEGEAIRASQNRSNMPRPEGMPRGQ